MVAKRPPLLPTIRASSSIAAANVMDVHHRNGDGIDRWQLRNHGRTQRNNIAIRDDLDRSAPASSTVTVSDEQREPCDDENIDMNNIATTSKTIEAFTKEESRDDPIEIGSVDAVMRNHHHDDQRRKRQHKLATVYENIIKHRRYHSYKRTYPTSTEQRDPYDDDMSSRSKSATKVEARDDAVYDHVTNDFSNNFIDLFDDESFAPTGDVAILSSPALMQHQPLDRCMDVMDVDHYDDDQESVNDDSIITTTTVATTITSSSSISSSSNPSRFVGFAISSSIDSSNLMSFNETIPDRRHTTAFESFMAMVQEDDRSTTTTKTNDVPIHIRNHQRNDDLPFEILCSNDSWDNHLDSREESHLSLDDDDDDEDEGN